MKSSVHAERGFTLLEVMLAFTALALVSAICYGAFHLGIRAVERGEIAVVTAQRLRSASDVLIRQVKSAVPYTVRNDENDTYPYFFGTPTEMRFVTAAALIGGGGMARVSYRLERDPPRLVLEEAPNFSPDALGRETFDPVGARAAVLLDNFQQLKFEYLLFDGAEYEWRTSWDAREEELMPVAVRVMIDGVPGTETGTWGQEIPLMGPTYSESSAEADEDSLQEKLDEVEAVGNAAQAGSKAPEATDGNDEGDDDTDTTDDGGDQ